MTLPTSGPINMSQVDVEIGRAPDALIYLGEPEVRDLADVPTGQIFMSNLYGKSFDFPVYGPGQYLFIVPPNVYTINILKMVAGGGGGSGTNGAGDIWGGGGGGSGGYLLNGSLSVTPGQRLLFNIGYGGESGRVTFNGPVLCEGTSGSTAGTNGQPTSIEQEIDGQFYEVALVGGGIAGTPAPNGDNGPGAPGAGGSPNGVAGSYQSPIVRNDFAGGAGGNNGTGYGGGGAGNGMSPFTCPTKGGNGYLSISWVVTPPDSGIGIMAGGRNEATMWNAIYRIDLSNISISYTNNLNTWQAYSAGAGNSSWGIIAGGNDYEWASLNTINWYQYSSASSIIYQTLGIARYLATGAGNQTESLIYGGFAYPDAISSMDIIDTNSYTNITAISTGIEGLGGCVGNSSPTNAYFSCGLTNPWTSNVVRDTTQIYNHSAGTFSTGSALTYATLDGQGGGTTAFGLVIGQPKNQLNLYGQTQKYTYSSGAVTQQAAALYAGDMSGAASNSVKVYVAAGLIYSQSIYVQNIGRLYTYASDTWVTSTTYPLSVEGLAGTSNSYGGVQS